MNAIRYVVHCLTRNEDSDVVTVLGEFFDKDEAVLFASSEFDSRIASDPNIWCRMIVVDLDSDNPARMSDFVLYNPCIDCSSRQPACKDIGLCMGDISENVSEEFRTSLADDRAAKMN